LIELTRTTIEVKIDDKTFNMRMPTYKEGIQYKSSVKECGDDEIKTSDLLMGYLEKLGMPKEVTETLEIGHLEKILEFILGAKKK
jgi:hypothetical protein